MNGDLEILMKNLGYEFKNQELLKQALTHRSLESMHNERMEFLGDSIVNFVVADLLFNLHRSADEGDLSRLRATLVNRDGLADIANQFQLSDYLRMGEGELKTGGYRRSSILSDALEAVIGAIYLDSDMVTCQQKVTEWFQPILANLDHNKPLKDPKTQLQEYLQAYKFSLPVYELLQTKGKQHEQTFVVECRIVENNVVGVGEGLSRRKAEQAAAQQCLEKLRRG